MAAVTSPETSPQPRVYFQTPAGTTEEPETPVRKQGRVTVKYDRKELRKRLNLEEWIIDQLTDLYDCEVTNKTQPADHGARLGYIRASLSHQKAFQRVRNRPSGLALLS